jgi:hypothetical protein
MNFTQTVSMLFLTAVLGILLGCQQQAKSPDVTDSVRRSLDQAGLKDVSVSQDRDKGVVTLSGTATSDTEKGQAEAGDNAVFYVIFNIVIPFALN